MPSAGVVKGCWVGIVEEDVVGVEEVAATVVVADLTVDSSFWQVAITEWL